MRSILKLYDRLLDICGILAGYLGAMVALGVATDITLRAFKMPGIPWMLDFVEYAMFAMTMLGAAYVMRLKNHVSVDLLSGAFGPTGQRLLRITTLIICIAITTTFFVFGLTATISTFGDNSLVFKSIVIPEWMPLALVPFMFFLLTVELIRQLVAVLSGEMTIDQVRRSDAL